MTRAGVTAVVLAGGEGRRMGGVDKGLTLLDGRPLIAHVIAPMRSQVSGVLISANRNIDRYACYGSVIRDDGQTGARGSAGCRHEGPLAGMLAGMRASSTEWIVTVPCDAPGVWPGDLVTRMRRHADDHAVDACVMVAAGTRIPVVMLARRSLAESLAAWLAAGADRRVTSWQTAVHAAEVAFVQPLINLNTTDELRGYRMPR